MEKTYTVGEKVAYNTSRNYPSSACFTHFSTVVKTSPHGFVWLENGMRFNRNGKQTKTKQHQSPSAALMDVATAMQIRADAGAQREQRDAIDSLQEALKSCTNTYSGRYFLDDYRGE